jgi:regulator of replication initiation timing
VDLDSRRDGMLRAQLRSGALRAQLQAVTQELEELREENARLRMDATRPRSLHRAADGLLAVADTVVQRSSADVERQDADQDELDDAWHRLAEARQLRTAVASALSELQVACEQLLSRLELGVGSMEIDRRAGNEVPPAASRTRRKTSTRSAP